MAGVSIDWMNRRKSIVEVRIIKEINYIDNDLLSISDTLLIPLSKSKSNNFIPYEMHIVSEGDTLWDLSKKYNIELIGADLNAIKKAEDRNLFKIAMKNIGVDVCPSGIASNLQEAEIVGNEISSFPKIIRPAFPLGGSGGGIAYNQDEFLELCKTGLDASPVSQILIEKSLLGWKEFELEVMRDLSDNVLVCLG